ncbi:hypothetical protein AHAS_Ahas02G0164000 [Arachis hypogaea]
MKWGASQGHKMVRIVMSVITTHVVAGKIKIKEISLIHTPFIKSHHLEKSRRAREINGTKFVDEPTNVFPWPGEEYHAISSRSGEVLNEGENKELVKQEKEILVPSEPPFQEVLDEEDIPTIPQHLNVKNKEVKAFNKSTKERMVTKKRRIISMNKRSTTNNPTPTPTSKATQANNKKKLARRHSK